MILQFQIVSPIDNYLPCVFQENGGESSEVEDNIPTHHLSSFNLNIPGQVVLWTATPRPPNSDKVRGHDNDLLSLEYQVHIFAVTFKVDHLS